MYCRRTFHELDVDGSGTLSLAELHTLLGGGASAAAAFAALDTMHTEEVSYTEYLAAVVAGQERSCRPHDNACIKAHALHAHCTCTCTCTAHALLAQEHTAHAQEHTAHAQEHTAHAHCTLHTHRSTLHMHRSASTTTATSSRHSTASTPTARARSRWRRSRRCSGVRGSK